MARERRGWIEVVASILDAANKKGGVNKTSIVYRANLNFGRLERYMEVLMEKGLIEQQLEGDLLFKTSERGKEFLDRYKRIRELI
ncbi:MAG: winged helix-turn-helix domain-containing protein [Candidatus Bathyarchaeota archaeon]|nr:winged helix-turn-helix domain-containing protein [Candidatus Bathyarchaeota archaeon]